MAHNKRHTTAQRFKILGVRKPIFPTCHCFEVSTSATCAHVQIAEPKANVPEDSLPLEHLESTPQRSSGHSQPILKTSEDRSRSAALSFICRPGIDSKKFWPFKEQNMQNAERILPIRSSVHPRHDEGPGRLFLNSRWTNTIQSFRVSPSGICSWLCSVSSNQLCTKPSDQT